MLRLCRNHPIDLLDKSVDWSLYNGNIGVNGKADAWLVNVNLYIHVFCFYSYSIFHFSLSCLRKAYDLSLKVAEKLLSIIFKFSMVSAQYLPLRTFFIDFIKLHRFIKPRLLNFPNFQSGQLLSSCLSFDPNSASVLSN